MTAQPISAAARRERPRAMLVPVITRDGPINVVPNSRTKAIANEMLRLAREENGADAAAALLPQIPVDQWPALVGILLRHARVRQLPGRPRMPLQYTDAERLEGNRRYKAGHRDADTMAKWREYQRVIQRRRTDRVGRANR
ncbi:MAG TPA: hypothetical protein VFQ11_10885 [Nocardioidaceae bacterium]|nr:hypothetical protein [Nocardioidaceae bacterium]